MGTAWEYFVDTVESGMMAAGSVAGKDLTDRLNWYGQQGWELVSAYMTAYAQGGTHFQVFIYKRERAAAAPGAAPGTGA